MAHCACSDNVAAGAFGSGAGGAGIPLIPASEPVRE